MIKHTEAFSVSQIFSNEKTILYSIPKYQREYTWGQKEWGLLFNDIIENDNGYFLGSIICVDKSISAMSDVELEVIDGQQRITSLSLLLITLYDKINAHKNDLDEDQNTDLVNIKREIVIRKEGKNIARLTPQVQNDNRADYFMLLEDKGLIINQERKKYATIRRIYKAYNYFSGLIDNYIEERKKDDKQLNFVEVLFELVRKINSATIVSIEVETNRDAYMLFESLNNRGIPLSAIDLIKNILISISDIDNKAEDCYLKWKNIISYLGDDYSVQERFFRQFYNAFREELNAPYPTLGKTKYYIGYLATRTTLLDIYEKLLKNDYEKILNRLGTEAKNYSVLINNATEEDKNYTLYESLLNLERIQGAPSYILLLYLLSNKKNLQLDDNMLKKIIDYLTKFFVRRNLTDYPNTRNLTKLFMDEITIITNRKGNDVVYTIMKHLKDNSSSDKEFVEKLNGPVYTDNPDACRFLLCYYENNFKTNEIYTDLWKKGNSNKYLWTIEHIFPEGENIPIEWVNMMADGNKDLALEYLNLYAHTLGNLTVTGYNSTLSNLSYEEKKNRKDKKGNYVGYKNGLKLNEDLVNLTEWKVQNIKDRTKKLVNFYEQEFKL